MVDIRNFLIFKAKPIEIIIGIEMHIQIISKYKIFSGLINQVNYIDEGMPGCLPSLNIDNLHKLVILANVFKTNLNA